MLFYKIVGGVIVLASGVACGSLLNSRDKSELLQIEALVALLNFTKNQIDCFSISAPQILSRYTPEGLIQCGYDSDISPKSFVEFVSCIKIKNAEARKIFSEFADDFGRGYRDEEIRRCEYHTERLEMLRKRSAEELAGKKKLNLTLCIAAALTVIILLI